MSINKMALVSALLAATVAAPAFASQTATGPMASMRCQGQMESADGSDNRAAAIGFATGQRGVQATRGSHCRVPIDIQRLAIQFATGQHGMSMKNLPGCVGMEGEGVVTSVSGAAVTLQHEAVAGMPAMVMAFDVMDQTLLGNLAAGDHVHFHLKASGDHYVIDQIAKQ
jgi:Cu/Ag efflux protein CusF